MEENNQINLSSYNLFRKLFSQTDFYKSLNSLQKRKTTAKLWRLYKKKYPRSDDDLLHVSEENILELINIYSSSKNSNKIKIYD